MQDPHHAFIDPALAVDGAPDGPLAGRRFAAKDLFDVAGHVAGCGNPDWARTHAPAAANAPVIDRLLAAGADLRGKTHTDELAYSLDGENPHYGTPANPNAPGRIPGGSSSGSAVAVAGGSVDFALGTDTGGSVRVPASYCGVFGLRPTHGRVPAAGVMPLAPSFDAVGWFARDPGLLRAVGAVVLDGHAPDEAAPAAVLVPTDVWALCEAGTAAALAGVREAVCARLGAGREIALAPDGLDAWLEPFRVLQGSEIHRAHKDWIAANDPRLGPGVAERLAWCGRIGDAERVAAERQREEIRARFRELLDDGAVMLVPSAPAPAPDRGRPVERREASRYRVLQMSALTPLSGNPQISLPLGRAEGLPVGLSLIAAHGRDEWLLGLAERLCGPAADGVAPLR